MGYIPRPLYSICVTIAFEAATITTPERDRVDRDMTVKHSP